MEAGDLWRQILKDPSNWGLQAAYVAALSKAKHPRAEVFRLAAELEHFPPYYVQHAGILKNYQASVVGWSADFVEAERRWNGEVKFVKGWPVEMTIAARDFAKHAREIVATVPVRHLNLKDVQEAAGVWDVPELAQIASLNGSGQSWSGEPIRGLAGCGHLGSLRWIDFSHTDLRDVDVEVLAAAPALRQVQHLDVRHNPCRDPVDASMGYGSDGITGTIVSESIYLPEFGKELEQRHGRIEWLNALGNFMEKHPPSRYLF